jgi:hypothetical protein
MPGPPARRPRGITGGQGSSRRGAGRAGGPTQGEHEEVAEPWQGWRWRSPERGRKAPDVDAAWRRDTEGVMGEGSPALPRECRAQGSRQPRLQRREGETVEGRRARGQEGTGPWGQPPQWTSWARGGIREPEQRARREGQGDGVGASRPVESAGQVAGHAPGGDAAAAVAVRTPQGVSHGEVPHRRPEGRVQRSRSLDISCHEAPQSGGDGTRSHGGAAASRQLPPPGDSSAQSGPGELPSTWARRTSYSA